MGKKKLRATYRSKGERRSISKDSLVKHSPIDRVLNKQAAIESGKGVWLTVPNPDPKNTKERMIRVKVFKKKGNKKPSEAVAT